VEFLADSCQFAGINSKCSKKVRPTSRIAAVSRGTRLLLGLAGALIVALLSLPAGALAASGGIAGTVSAGGARLSGDQVCAHGTNSSFSLFCAVSNPNGEYTISGLAAGEYRVRFEGKGEFIGRWFDGAKSEAAAQLVTVTEGVTTPGVDGELTPGATVEGTITDAAGGAALEGVRVCAATGFGNPINNGCATSGAAGHYRLVGIPTGEYELRFEPEASHANPDYLTHYYPEVANIGEGTALHLTEGQTTAGIDTAMHLGGTISGTVRDAEGHPIGGITACVYPVLGNTNAGYCITHRAETASDGAYTVHALESGEYKVSFAAGGFAPGNYLPQFYPARPTRATGGAVVVSAPAAVAGIDATLQKGGSITGHVVEGGTLSPLVGASVCASRTGGTTRFCSQVKADGSYSIASLASGGYVVEFAAANGSFEWPFVPVFSGGASDRADATPVAVTAGAESAGVDATVQRGGTIAGLITDASSGDPAEGIYVCAVASGGTVGHCDTTHANGEYEIVGLPSGSYAVRATPAGGGVDQDFLIGNKHYMAEFFGEAASAATATPVAGGPGTAATGKDIAMHEGGGISGTVTGPLGEALPSIGACVVEAVEDLGTLCGTSDAGGHYEIPGLRPGDHEVRFSAYGLQSQQLSAQYYEDVLGFGEATPVPVVGAAVTPDIDAQMHPAGTIEGTVTDAYDGTPLKDVRVCAEAAGGLGGNCAETGADGHYSMSVGAGSYTVEFSLGYLDQVDGEQVEVEEFRTGFFAGATTQAASTAVTVGSGATRSGVDADLTPAPGRVDSVSVAKAGSGAGAVTSSPAGIDCGADCSEAFETRKTITLRAEPAAGSTFTGWTGACSGTGPCQIRLTAAADVSATFQSSGTATTSPLPTVTSMPPAKPPVVQPTKPTPQCKKGFLRKRFGKTVRCVKKPKHHRPRRHRPKQR
jgi:hypothetical protein